MQHQSKSPHVHRLMGGHPSGQKHSPADILMRGHKACGGRAYAGGGDIGRAGMAIGGAPPIPRFKHGGKIHRCHRDAGGILTNDEMTGQGSKPLVRGLKRGGKCHRQHRAMGGVGKLRKGVM